MRLLVVRCLAFAVVQAETMARGNAGVNAGTLASLCSACRAESIFKATAGLSVCVSTVRFGLPWRGFGLFGKLGRQNVSRFIGRDLFNGGGFVRFDDYSSASVRALPARGSLGGT